MKKMFICCGVLCMTLLLFCGSAFAAVTVTKSDDTVDVTVNDAATEVTVNKKSGAEKDKLYLVMIQKGAETDKPTAENLYYLDVDKASDATFTKAAYPKDLTEGTYVVFLSDYSGSSNGARKAVATLTVGGSGGTGGTGTGGGDIGANPGNMKGDLDNDNKRTVDDVLKLIEIIVNEKDAQETAGWLDVADYDGDKRLTVDDVLALISIIVNE